VALRQKNKTRSAILWILQLAGCTAKR
jgi:hypothetical protein